MRLTIEADFGDAVDYTQVGSRVSDLTWAIYKLIEAKGFTIDRGPSGSIGGRKETQVIEFCLPYPGIRELLTPEEVEERNK